MKKGAKRKPRWTTNEQAAIVALMTVLVVSAAFFGVLLFTGNFSCQARALPCPNPETLNVLSSTVNSPTNVTLQIINSGSITVTLVAYYVEDSSGQAYSATNWQGPTLQPNTVTLVNFLIDGKAFTFQSHYSYTVKVITSNNYNFSFTVNV